jgi:hypothetical protein
MIMETKALDVRQFINDELKRQGKSKYWLGKTVKERGGANRETVLRYLRGDRDTTGGVIAVMLTALGVQLVSAGGDPSGYTISDPRLATPREKRRAKA